MRVCVLFGTVIFNSCIIKVSDDYLTEVMEIVIGDFTWLFFIIGKN